MLLGVWNYTVVATYIGMIFGFMGIRFAYTGSLKFALLCLMMAGFCDMFDGKIASTKKNRTIQEKHFGIQIDSLSDLICFGVLPAVIVSQYVGDNQYLLIIPALYTLAALVRLAWFNVDEEERQSKTCESRQFYMGLPVTSSALLLPIIFEIACYLQANLSIIAPISLAIIACAFVIPFHLGKPHTIGKLILVACGLAELAFLLSGVIR